MRRIAELVVPGAVGVLLMAGGLGLTGAEDAGAHAPDPTPAAPAPAPEPPSDPVIDCAVLKCVALTFDDGPSAEHTEGVLQTLTDHEVPATFFMQGPNLTANPDIARKVAETPGMEIGNHTMTHPDLTGVTSGRLREEITGGADRIEEITGTRPTVMRPPYGLTNDAVAQAAREDDQSVILWDVDTEDWRGPEPGAVLDTVHEQVKPGSIVLMHDVHGAGPSALPEMIDGLKADGYTLVTVSELIGSPEPGTVYDARVDAA